MRARHICFLSLMATLMMLLVPATSASAAAGTIQFLNPSPFGSEVPIVSDALAANGTYRLSAWTGNAPSDAIVEFELVSSTDPVTGPLTIGVARKVGPDTYEAEWDINNVLNGEHTLRATLYDALTQQEISSDTQRVTVLTGTVAAETVDITYPRSGEGFGMFTNAKGVSNGVLDIKQNSDVDAVAYYTTSAPGTPPDWKECHGGEIASNQVDGVRCTLQRDNADTPVNEGDSPSAVTAVGVLLLNNGGSAASGDAVRTLPYIQDPKGLSSSFTTAYGAGDVGAGRKNVDEATGSYPCSDWITFRVTDQFGRTIGGANVDVEAQGPSDQLKFDTGWLTGLTSRKNQAPDANHGGTENGHKCTTSHDHLETQADHNVLGAPDVKHVETFTGTTDDGEFSVRLRTDSVGATYVSGWVDHVDDDRFCVGEEDAAASASLGWGVDAPSASTPPPSSSCSGTPDPGPITPDPDDPDPQEPTAGERSITLDRSFASVPKGSSVRLFGSILGEEECQANQTVKLKARRGPGTRFRLIRTLTTGQGGVYETSVEVTRTKQYRAVAPATTSCLRAVSPITSVRAR